jgi:hypothetical protein
MIRPSPVEPGDGRHSNGDTKMAGNKFQESKTHCPAGHEYTPENTKLIKSTQPGRFKRQCRKCKSDSAKARAKEAREEKLKASAPLGQTATA